MLFPALERTADTAELLPAARSDHEASSRLVGELGVLRPDSPEFESRFGELRTRMLRHMQDEDEGEGLLMRAIDLGPAFLIELGKEMTERREAMNAPLDAERGRFDA